MSDFKAGNQRIDAVCRSISELVLVATERKKIYAHTEFQEVQAAHLAGVRDKLSESVDEIRDTLANIYKVNNVAALKQGVLGRWYAHV